MITNLCKTPNGTVVSSYRFATERRQETSGKWSYRVNTTSRDTGTFEFKMGTSSLQTGDWLACIYSCADPSALTSNKNSGHARIAGTGSDTTIGGVISETMGWVAARVYELSANEIWISETDGWVTLEGCSAFTAEDWEHVLNLCRSGILTHPWVDGQTLPIGGGYLSSGFLARPHLDCEVAA